MIKPGALCHICKDKNGNIFAFRNSSNDLKQTVIQNQLDVHQQNIQENQLAFIIRKQIFTRFKVTNASYYECLINGNIFIVSENNLMLDNI